MGLGFLSGLFEWGLGVLSGLFVGFGVFKWII